MMQRSKVARAGGSILDKMMPGWQEKVWARYPKGYKEYTVKSKNDAYEGAISQHKWWSSTLLTLKTYEKGMVPSQKFRKPAVDWRRQMERGTMTYGRWYEGPYGSDYRPGNTFDRLANVKAPFTPAEWEERKQYRSWDLLKFAYGLFGIFMAYRITNEWPVVWCEEKPTLKDAGESEEQ
mmetsp:Transcript_44577/g.105668  ORF Transcript_44577/g.105668 Transcript_44577/m.105668 type:complete len:179 (+) Transcript_44577:119-655(+)|eukprot:CAMPEP_0178403342 /NCGR_PEP_ID=MMETSP0689_2-20121128/17317_1 /TAXON_ID=160604 /ORGANISM="Amphidinium massartii, Strain CS-259" /LENGTH=178 /DNA_ID=CAMNT_0020024289 /DNA_START=116 /DNA_END=652 /DNA_ORIENTATION=+